MLLSVISPSRSFDLYESAFEIEEADKIILLTDGVYNLLSRQEIVNLSIESKTCEILSNRMEEMIRSRDPKDDFSAITITRLRD